MKFQSLISLLTLSVFLLSACAGSNSRHTNACNGKRAAGYYCVQPGDTLYKLGQRFGLSVAQLKSLNQLRGDTIHVGQSLRVQATAPAANSDKTTAVKLQWPLSGSIVTEYSRQSNGIDIAAAPGTPVKAAADGTVIYVGDSVRGYGKLILLKHSDTLLTAYAHNETVNVSSQQKVKAGQTLASVGLNGKGESMLHFEVRLNGKSVNPMLYLPTR